MTDNVGNRDFERFSLRYTMDITGNDIEGNPFTETTALEDISGGGARFCSMRTGTYYIDQTLEFTINLPETEKLTASMEGRATVVRIIEQASPGQSKCRLSVAVTLDTLMEFGMTESTK
jgi:hypothetical protein